jgi:hypothetical protein
VPEVRKGGRARVEVMMTESAEGMTIEEEREKMG